MTQNRDAPAYQEYAANNLAKKEFRLMSKGERGIFITMRYECWCNKTLPANIEDLSRYLGLDISQQELDAVMPFFESDDDLIISPELEGYRNYLENRKNRQSQGGKRGAAITNKKRKSPKKPKGSGVLTTPTTTPTTTPQVPRRGLSTVQPSTVQPSTAYPNKGVIDSCSESENEMSQQITLDVYQHAMDNSPPTENEHQCTADDYARAKGGD